MNIFENFRGFFTKEIMSSFLDLRKKQISKNLIYKLKEKYGR